MKNFRKNIQKFGGLVISTTFILQPTLAQAQIQRSFINPSFEQPTFSNSCYIQVDESQINGWTTSHSSRQGTASCVTTGFNTLGKIIEIWTKGFSSVNTATGAGNQFAELNAEENSQLYQNLCLYQNETITFSLLHRGRSSSSTADVANFLIGLITDPSPTVFGRFSTTSNGTVTTQPVALNGATIPTVTNNNAGNGWVRYNGSVPYAGATGNRPVGFAAVSTAGANNTIGNFLDDVQFAGKPVLEFVASSGGGPELETNPSTNPPKLRIVGLVPTGGVSVPIEVSGTAILGTHFTTTSGTTNFNVIIPAGNYDGSNATSVFTIPFTVINNNVPEGVRTIIFTIQPSSSFFASSTLTCGGSPTIVSNYTIYDDDFISGKVWNDADNSANNTFTNINTGSETGTNAGGLLNAILVDSNNQVLKTSPVAADGTYTFLDVPLNINNVKIILSTTAGTVGNTAPTPSLPSNWINTSPLTTATFNTGTSISNKDFGIEQLPNTNNVNAASQPNPTGTNKVQVPAFSGTDPEDGTLGSGKSFKILALPTNGTLYYNNTLVTAGQVITNYDPTKLTLDPNDGIITVSFTYAAIDAAGKEDPTPATVTMPFTAPPVSLSGIVFNDADGTKLQNGTETGTNAGGLNAVLINGTNQVVATTTVAANGTYTFSNVPANANYTVQVTTATATVGSAPPSVILPNNWVSTGENINSASDGTVDGKLSVTVNTSDITDVNFGIEQLPDTTIVNGTSQTNPGGTTQVQVPTLAGNDPEDGVLGSGNSFKITTLPTNGTLYYDNSAVTAGQVISNYDPTKLTIDPNDGNVTVSFTYAAIDAAGQEDPTPATVTKQFTSAPTGSANLLLVKRITRINNQDLTDIVDGLSSVSPTATNYVAPSRANDDNDPKWPIAYLRGLINAGTVKPGDELEYTVYFLSNGQNDATNVRLCDLVPDNVAFIPSGFNGLTPNDGGLAETDQGIALALGSSTPTVYFSNVTDSDRGTFYPANDPNTPNVCNNIGTNTNGAIVVEITRLLVFPNIPPASASGTPANSYGFIRFRAKVRE